MGSSNYPRQAAEFEPTQGVTGQADGAGCREKAARNLISWDRLAPSGSVPSCLLTHDMLKKKSLGSPCTRLLVRNASSTALIGRGEVGRRQSMEGKEEVGGCPRTVNNTYAM